MGVWAGFVGGVSIKLVGKRRSSPSLIVRVCNACKPSLPIWAHDSPHCTRAVRRTLRPSRTAVARARVSSRSFEAK
jgi:hypothetical protein